MKIDVMSDLHLEHEKNQASFWKELDEYLAKIPASTLVLAGDIYPAKDYDGLRDVMLKFAQRYSKVLYIPGNHESWGGDIHTTNSTIAALATSQVTVLSPGKVTDVEGRTFTGGTLWFPDTTDRLLKAQWCDYWMVREADWTIPIEHHKFVKWLDNPDCKADIVVTHHYPTDESIAPRWAGQETNIFFSARIDGHVASMVHKPKLWIHGHTHDPLDYVSKHGYRVYCNPRGYPFENANPHFWDRVSVEV